MLVFLKDYLISMGANTFSHCDSCPGPFPLQDIKHDNTCPSVVTGAGRGSIKNAFRESGVQGKCCAQDYLKAALKITDIHIGQEEIAYPAY